MSDRALVEMDAACEGWRHAFFVDEERPDKTSLTCGCGTMTILVDRFNTLTRSDAKDAVWSNQPSKEDRG